MFQKYSVEVVSKRMASAINEADEISMDMMLKYNDGDGKDLNTFLKKYIKSRGLYHSRMAKQERLTQARSAARSRRNQI
jgi:hypothetical protein